MDHQFGAQLSLILVSVVAVVVGLATLAVRINQRLRVSAIAILAFVALGILHSANSVPSRGDSLSRLATRKAEPIVAKATISGAAIWSPNPNHRSDDPQSKAQRTQWPIQVMAVRDQSDTWREVEVRSTLQVEGRIHDLFPGDEVLVHGSFRRIYPPTNPGGFDRQLHAARDERYVAFKVDDRSQITLEGNGGSFPFSRMRAKAVAYVDKNLRTWVTHDQAPLAAALVFGQRQQVDWQDQQELMATGTLHMLAISGMHVEIVAFAVVLLCSVFKLKDWQRFVVLASLCVAYAVLAAAKPPVLRATILVVAFEFARIQGRQARLGNLLAFAGIILFWSSFSHLFNAGVHLSFLAVASIGIFLFESKSNLEEESPLKALIRENWGLLLRWSHLVWRKFRASCQLSFWVWLITCPLIWWHFNLVSPIAIPLNVILMIPLTLGLLAGLIAGMLGPVPIIGPLFGGLCGYCLNLISGCVDIAAAIRWGHFWLPSPPLWCLLLFYTCVLFWLVCFQKERRKLLACVLATLVAIMVSLDSVGPRGFATRNEAVSTVQDELRVTFLDVGHGTSVIVEMPTGAIWVYDAGHMGSPERSHEEIASTLWSLGASRIERLFVSHADSDHYNAIEGLASRFRIDQVVSTSRFFQSDDRPVRELVTTLQDKQVELIESHAGDAGELAGLKWKVLHPGKGAWVASDNASSLTLLLEYDSVRILLPGDLEAGGLATLVELPPRPCHILMAPHHGSVTLDPQDLLLWCKPEFVAISGNHRADRQRVLSRYQAPGRNVAVTFRDGAIQCRIKGGHASYWRWSRKSDDVEAEPGWLPWSSGSIVEKSSRSIVEKSSGSNSENGNTPNGPAYSP